MERPAQEHHPLYESLMAISGRKYVSDDDFAVYAYSRTVSEFPARIPGIVVRPGATEEISDIVKLANRTGIPIIPRGGGMAVGGTPKGVARKSILLDTTRMDKIIDVDEDAMTVTTECGVSWARLKEELSKRRLYTRVAYTSKVGATVGGLLSGSHGGGEVEQWGGRENVGTYLTDLKVVLPKGDIIHTGSAGSNHLSKPYTRYSHGPEATGLFLADQGILGVKVEATLKLFQPPFIDTDSYLFEGLDPIWKACCELSKLDCPPVGHFKILPPTSGYVTGMLKLPAFNSWIGNLAVDGPNREAVEMTMRQARMICEKHGGKRGPQRLIDAARHGVFDGADNPQAMGPSGMWCFAEYRLPLEPKTLDHMKFIGERYKKNEPLFEKYHLLNFELYMLGVHQTLIVCPNIFIGDNTNQEARGWAQGLFKDWIRDGHLAGGINHFPQGDLGDVSAEFYEPHYFGFLHMIKRALDPNNIMNPGALTI